MHPRTKYEFLGWFKVILAVGLVIFAARFFLDHLSATVEWRKGYVVGKRWEPGQGTSVVAIVAKKVLESEVPPEGATCYIDVDLDGLAGSVLVDRLDYSDFKKGQSCEVAFRHGRLRDYLFDAIRHPPNEKRFFF